MEPEEQRQPTTPFAPPPPLWKHFTPDKLDKLEQIKAEASKEDEQTHRKKKWSPAELRALEVPPELRYLVPPELPTEEYSVFGEMQSVSTVTPVLPDPLYQEPATDPSQPAQPLNHAYYLLKISKSLLLNFLEFVGILSVAPEQFMSKVDDLRSLFVNAHHLLNLYRPHQARESLILMMEQQLERSREEIQQMDKVRLEIESLLDQLQTEGSQVESTKQSPEDTGPSGDTTQSKIEKSRLVWDLLDQED